MKLNIGKAKILIAQLVLLSFFSSSSKCFANEVANSKLESTFIIKKEKDTKIVEPTTAMTTIAYVAKLASAMNKIKQAKRMKNIESMLGEALIHLREIRKDVFVIKLQNEEILKKLDELPKKLQGIFFKELKNHELDMAYNELDDIIENYSLIEEFRKSMEIDKPGYQVASSSFKFAVSHENSLFGVVKLTYYSEFLLMSTNYACSKLVLNRLEAKQDLLKKLMGAYNEEIQKIANSLIDELRNEEYITNHNLDTFTKINDLEYKFKPILNDEHCWIYTNGEYFLNKDCYSWKYNNDLRSFRRKIEALKLDLTNKLEVREELKSVINHMDEYINSVKSNTLN